MEKCFHVWRMLQKPDANVKLQSVEFSQRHAESDGLLVFRACHIEVIARASHPGVVISFNCDSDGDSNRFEDLFKAHLNEIYRFKIRFTGDSSVAEDLVQETFISAYRSLSRLKTPEHFRAWL